MKWTTEMAEELTRRAYAGEANKDIAAALGVPVADIYAQRSRLGITIDKVKARKAATINPEFEAAVQEAEAGMKFKVPPNPRAPKGKVEKQFGAESFINAGELCFVLDRTGDTALIFMPTKTSYPYVVPLVHKPGASDWWHGKYFDSLKDAWDCYKEEAQK